jgi:hypothetical protein
MPFIAPIVTRLTPVRPEARGSATHPIGRSCACQAHVGGLPNRARRPATGRRRPTRHRMANNAAHLRRPRQDVTNKPRMI